MYYIRVKEGKKEKEGKMRLASQFPFTQYSLPS